MTEASIYTNSTMFLFMPAAYAYGRENKRLPTDRSILKLVDGEGREHFTATYDAWGNRTITNNTFGFEFDRGYTGHEHLYEFGLINMNGRVYDPVLGRFLSPDPFVQMPDNTQNFNRYSYCLNNPLKCNDPSKQLLAEVTKQKLDYITRS